MMRERGENDVLMGNLIRGPQQHGIWVGEEGERSRFPLPTHCDTRVNIAMSLSGPPWTGHGSKPDTHISHLDGNLFLGR